MWMAISGTQRTFLRGMATAFLMVLSVAAWGWWGEHRAMWAAMNSPKVQQALQGGGPAPAAPTAAISPDAFADLKRQVEQRATKDDLAVLKRQVDELSTRFSRLEGR